MERNNVAIIKFFESYAVVSMRDDPKLHANLYAKEFIAAGPSGSAVYKNDSAFIEWLKQVYDFNQKTGMETLQVVSVKSEPIGESYTFATVEWGAKFRKTGGELIHFEISYLLQWIENKPKILAYVDHEDQQKVMKERGLI
jgi:hypothetical protein